MNRPGCFALIAAISCTSGCELLRMFERPIEPPGEKVKMPKSPAISPKSYQYGQRVEDVGQHILTQNVFPGINPLFHTVGVKDLVLFHRGSGELFISETLVERCKSDEELAAVLCSELGKMKAEKLSAKRVGLDRDGFLETGKNATPRFNNPAEPHLDVGDPNAFAHELMIGAGFDPALLDRVAPMLRETEKSEALRKQMAGSAPAPQWRK